MNKKHNKLLAGLEKKIIENFSNNNIFRNQGRKLNFIDRVLAISPPKVTLYIERPQGDMIEVRIEKDAPWYNIVEGYFRMVSPYNNETGRVTKFSVGMHQTYPTSEEMKPYDEILSEIKKTYEKGWFASVPNAIGDLQDIAELRDKYNT